MSRHNHRNRRSRDHDLPGSHERLLDRAYQEAVRVLRRCVHPLGLEASAKAGGYRQVWTRDCMITLLGACLIRDQGIQHALRQSMDLIRRHQSPRGISPNNVDTRSGKPNFQAYADGGLWYVIGHHALFQQSRKIDFLKRSYSSILKSLEWYEYQDVGRSGLVSIQEASDWQDLFAIRAKGLYINILHYFSLKQAGDLARRLRDKGKERSFPKRSAKVKSVVNRYLWHTPEEGAWKTLPWSFGVEGYSEKKLKLLQRRHTLPAKTILKKSSYYLPYITFRDFGEWFDSFGHLLAILTGLADQKRAAQIPEFMARYGLARPFPVKSIYPPVWPRQKDWRHYYRFDHLNLPHQYHNGGIWPFLGGFYVAALAKIRQYEQAQDALLLLAKLNQRGRDAPWEFNEWFHGVTAQPMERAEQAWSAGMYLYAHEAVRRKRAPFFSIDAGKEDGLR